MSQKQLYQQEIELNDFVQDNLSPEIEFPYLPLQNEAEELEVNI
jgi:hypothetical protein